MNYWARSAICDLRHADWQFDTLTKLITSASYCGVNVVRLNAACENLDLGALFEITRFTHNLGMKVIADFSTIASESKYIEILQNRFAQALVCEIDGISLPNFLHNGGAYFAESLTRRFIPYKEIAIIKRHIDSVPDYNSISKKNNVSTLHPVELITPNAKDFCATVLNCQIRQALRQRKNGFDLWIHATSCSHYESIANSEYSPVSQPSRQLYTTLLSCLKGPFSLNLPNGMTSESESSEIRQLLMWRQHLDALQSDWMILHPSDPNVVSFTRKGDSMQMTCMFNASDRFVRKRLPDKLWNAGVVYGSGLRGGRIVNRQIDLDPWGAIFLRS